MHDPMSGTIVTTKKEELLLERLLDGSLDGVWLGSLDEVLLGSLDGISLGRGSFDGVL